jgi:hypothetical protein
MINSCEDLSDLHGLQILVNENFHPLHDGHIGYVGEASKPNNQVPFIFALDKWIIKKHRTVLTQADIRVDD